VQWVVATSGEVTIDRDQILYCANFARQTDHVTAQAQRLRLRCAIERRENKRLTHYFICLFWLWQTRVIVHHASDELRVERAPVHANTHWLAILDRRFDHGGELIIALCAMPHVAWVDTQLGECFGTTWHFGQKFVSVEMKIAYQGHVNAHLVELRTNLWHCACGLHGVDGNSHHLGSGSRQRRHLGDGGHHIFGIRIGHRLHHDGRISPHENVTNFDLTRLTTHDVVHHTN
jgi:hypothetical protein